MAVITCIEDLKTLHRRRVPRMFYDYAESGSWTEGTFRRNSSDFDALELRQRVAIDISERRLAATMLGQDVRMPVALAPCGMAGMQHADGEIHAARAAAAFGVPFTLSTMSVCSIEDVAGAVDAPFWFQLYVMKDRDYVGRLIDRARDAGCSALVLTLDLAIMGQRHKDIKNGLSAPPKPTLANIVNLTTKPRWCLGMLGTRRYSFGNVVGHVSGVDNMGSLSAWSAGQLDPSLSWDDVQWVRERWGDRPFVLKGIMDAADAEQAVAAGADAIVVSNHGGRQLDGAPSTLRALPAISAAVGNRCEVWLDSGIRSGQDVLKALASGADATMIGRAWLYGLGAMGGAGVTRCLEVIENELDLTMAFCGVTDVAKLSDDVLLPT